ncbi:MAG TPA: hypothetical protein DD438_05360 [Verrucomicrobiales bacterium]|nr:hypothetical protein [Roseibacillus sp.]HBM77517.1 hypothetical protein [Verrucomicrobiales bacterium]
MTGSEIRSLPLPYSVTHGGSHGPDRLHSAHLDSVPCRTGKACSISPRSDSLASPCCSPAPGHHLRTTHQPDLRQPDHPDPQGLRGTARRSPPETENHCQFLLVTVPIARKALAGIKPIYEVFEAPEHLEFVAHEGGHVIEVLALLAFLGKHLGHEQ